MIEKIMLLEEYGRLQSKRNLSLNGAVVELGVNKCLLSKWRKDIARLHANQKSCKRVLCNGPDGQLNSISDELLQWIFARCKQGIGIRNTLVS